MVIFKTKNDLHLIPGLEALNKERKNVLRLFDDCSMGLNDTQNEWKQDNQSEEKLSVDKIGIQLL